MCIRDRLPSHQANGRGQEPAGVHHADVVDERESAARVDVDRRTWPAPPVLLPAEQLRGVGAQLGAQRPDRERLVELTAAVSVKARPLYGDSPVMGRLCGLDRDEIRNVM